MSDPIEPDAWFRFWTSDWQSGTNRMRNDEVGVFLRLCLDYYKNGPLPNDVEVLRCVSHESLQNWQRIWGVVKSKFVEGPDGLLHNSKCDEEIAWRKEQHTKRVNQTERARQTVLQGRSQDLLQGRSQVGENREQRTENRYTENQSQRREKGDGAPRSPLVLEVFEAWNKSRLPKCLLVSDKRRREMEVRSNEPFFVANWRSALDKCEQSDFCRGKNERGWKATFDWFIRRDSVVKLMEGKYDRKPQAQPRDYCP